MSVVRFKDDTTEVEAQNAADEDFDELFKLIDEELGSSVEAKAGDTAVLNTDLKEGLYGMACFVPSDGEPHIRKGMRIFFRVA